MKRIMNSGSFSAVCSRNHSTRAGSVRPRSKRAPMVRRRKAVYPSARMAGNHSRTAGVRPGVDPTVTRLRQRSGWRMATCCAT